MVGTAIQEMGQVMEIREVASGAKWKRPNTGRVVIKIKYRKCVAGGCGRVYTPGV